MCYPLPLRCRPHMLHESLDILKTADFNYRKEVVLIRSYVQEQYQNWLVLDALKSKWWIWEKIAEEVSISIKNISTYLERAQAGINI